jgi:hypothetical protein
MTRKMVLCIFCLVVLVGVHSAVASAEIIVGVKKGDWVTYSVAITGDVPEQHDVTWCKIEVVDVEEKRVYVDITSRYSDGREEIVPSNLNFETGHIGECFIIPSNLNADDRFKSPEGNITISGVKEETYLGATRSIAYASNPQTTFHWDRSTGFLLAANSSGSGFTMNTKVEKTNMWQSQILGLHPIVFISLLALVIVLVLILAIFMIRKLKK